MNVPAPGLIRLTLPYPPTGNRVRTVRRMANGGAALMLTKQARDYREAVRWAALKARARPLEGPVAVSFVAYRPRRVGDLDNLFKASFDSLKGIAWLDDSQVVEIHAFRLDDKAHPRVEVRVTPFKPTAEPGNN